MKSPFDMKMVLREERLCKMYMRRCMEKLAGVDVGNFVINGVLPVLF